MSKQHNITAIDIGSSKIITLIGQISDVNQSINILGASSIDSIGIRKGQIVNIEEAADAIIKSVEAAERMAGVSASKIYVSVNGGHIGSMNSHGVVAVGNPQDEIVAEDVRRVIEAARAVSLPSSQEIIHVIPRFYNVDAQEGIADPIGMSGVRLEVETHIITGSSTAIKNLTKCVGEIGGSVGGLIYSGLASAEATLTETEKELGVILVDFGGGTTSIAVYLDGSPAYISVLPFGAKNVTNDLAIGLRLSLDNAEKLKIYLNKEKTKFRDNRIGSALLGDQDTNENKVEKDDIDLAVLGIYDETKTVSQKTIVEGIIKPRLSEIFGLVSVELQKSGYGGLTPSGIVLTGGGSLIVGAVEACKKSMALPVRIGIPSGITGLIDDVVSPVYSCAVGLLMYGLKQGNSETNNANFPRINRIASHVKLGSAGKRIFDFVKSFLP